jgi:integrase
LKNHPGGEFVFPRRGNILQPLSNVDHAWRRLRTVAGLSDVRVHDLRRTAGSWATQAGMPAATVGRLLGHGTLHATAVYSISDTAAARQAAEAVAARLNRRGD